MLINVCFDISAEIISCIDSVGNNIQKYKEEFDEWYYNPENYSIREDWNGAETFVRWINKNYPESNAKVEVKKVAFEDLDSNNPTIGF